MSSNKSLFANTDNHDDCGCHKKEKRRVSLGQTYRGVPTRRIQNVESGHYDFGASLSLSYDDGMHPVTEFTASQSRFTFGQEQYYVQPFEDNTGGQEEERPAMLIKEQLEEDGAKKTPKSPTILPPIDKKKTPLPQLPTDKPPQKMPVMPGDDMPERMPVLPGDDTPERMPVMPNDEQPVPMNEGEADDNFAADLTAILKGQKQYDEATKQVVSKDRESRRQAPPPSRNPKPTMNEFETNEHAIFDKIAQSMKLANAYDLGTVALEQRFDNFDKAENEEAKKKLNY